MHTILRSLNKNAIKVIKIINESLLDFNISSTITSILDSVQIENDSQEINQSTIPSEIYEVSIQMKSIPFLKIKNMKNLKIKVRDLYRKAIELKGIVVKQNEEINNNIY